MLFDLVEIATANVESSQADGIEANTKRIKMTETSTSSLLLETPDILKNVYSFLMFKEALEIRRTCRHARQNDIDIFQYSNMEAPKWTNTTNYPRNYDKARDYLLCNLKSTEKLGAALSNKTFPRSHSEQMLWKLVCHSKTDNGPAVALLLQHKACWSLDSYDDPCELLDIVLQKDFVDMAAVFQKHNVIQANMKMCFTCSAHVGAYKCSCQVECCHVPPRSDGNKWDFYNHDHPQGFVVPKYCRACVLLASDARCSGCHAYTCPECIHAKQFRTCCKCKSLVCQASWEGCSIQCMECKRVYCATCNKHEDYVPLCEFAKCASCRVATRDGMDDPWGDEDY